jgi:hypothetical protein
MQPMPRCVVIITAAQGVRGVGFVSGGHPAVLRAAVSTALIHVSDWYAQPNPTFNRFLQFAPHLTSSAIEREKVLSYYYAFAINR